MDVDRPVLCGMPLSAVPVKIPILMQVRWTEKASAGDRFRVGLQFLLLDPVSGVRAGLDYVKFLSVAAPVRLDV